MLRKFIPREERKSYLLFFPFVVRKIILFNALCESNRQLLNTLIETVSLIFQVLPEKIIENYGKLFKRSIKKRVFTLFFTYGRIFGLLIFFQLLLNPFLSLVLILV